MPPANLQPVAPPTPPDAGAQGSSVRKCVDGAGPAEGSWRDRRVAFSAILSETRHGRFVGMRRRPMAARSRPPETTLSVRHERRHVLRSGEGCGSQWDRDRALRGRPEYARGQSRGRRGPRHYSAGAPRTNGRRPPPSRDEPGAAGAGDADTRRRNQARPCHAAIPSCAATRGCARQAPFTLPVLRRDGKSPSGCSVRSRTPLVLVDDVSRLQTCCPGKGERVRTDCDHTPRAPATSS